MEAESSSRQAPASSPAQPGARVHEALSGVTERIEEITAAAERSAAEVRARARADAEQLLERSREQAQRMVSERVELADRRAAEREQALERRIAAREAAAAEAVARTELAIERIGAAMGTIRDQFETVAAELRAAATEVQRSRLGSDARVEEPREGAPDADGMTAFEFPRAESRTRSRRRRAG